MGQKTDFRSRVEARFQRLFDAQPNAVFHISGEGVFLDVNKKACELLGYEKSELVGARLEKLVPSEILDDSYDRIMGLKEHKTFPPYRKHFRAKDGSEIPFEITVFSSVDENGELIIQSVCRDLRAELETERQLRTSEDRFRTLIDSAVDSIWTKDQDGHYTLVNQAMLTKLGKQKEDMIGLTAAEVHPQATALEIAHTDGQVLKEGKTIRVEHKMVQEGLPRTIQVVKAPIRDADGNTIGLVGIDRDITEERSLGEKLLQAQKMEAISSLASGLAHDFNNLLTGIIGNLSLALLKQEDAEDATTTIKLALDAAENAAKLTKQLLQISRKYPANAASAHLGEVIEDVVSLLSSTIDRRIKLQHEIPDDIWPAFADRNQIHQVLMNLCVNARDALEERYGPNYESTYAHPWCLITAENVELSREQVFRLTQGRPGKFVRLTISDNGIGMSKETVNRAFDPFYTTKPRGKGTGLGLAMVYWIVTNHNGWISIESELGIGTDIIIYLPKAEEEQKEGKKPLLVTPPEKIGEKKVLVVEDEQSVRDLLRRVLLDTGFQVEEAANGLDAWSRLKSKNKHYDLVILDMVMPEMSGHQLLQLMNRKELNIPVVVCSGYPGELTAIEMKDLGVIQFLEKPFTPERFLQVIFEALGQLGENG